MKDEEPARAESVEHRKDVSREDDVRESEKKQGDESRDPVGKGRQRSHRSRERENGENVEQGEEECEHVQALAGY